MAKRKATAKSDAPAEEKKSSSKLNWYVKAKRNARLADGTVVQAGESVKVDKEYVERLREENVDTFEIYQK
tara:strand:- start:1606 stop:1818 length:213 start_codon:yes stop_codon:yes gene_type:complete